MISSITCTANSLYALPKYSKSIIWGNVCSIAAVDYSRQENGTHSVVHLRTAPDPPAVIVIEDWNKGVPVKQWFSVEELVDRDPNCPLRGCRQRELHVDLATALSAVLSRAKRILTMFSVSSWSGVLSITSVPRISASFLPPLMARSLQYALILDSPPSHSRKSRPRYTKHHLISPYSNPHRLKRTWPNAEVRNGVVGSYPCCMHSHVKQ